MKWTVWSEPPASKGDVSEPAIRSARYFLLNLSRFAASSPSTKKWGFGGRWFCGQGSRH